LPVLGVSARAYDVVSRRGVVKSSSSWRFRKSHRRKSVSAA